MSNFSLFFANATVAMVLSIVFLVAGYAKQERYWNTWSFANAVIVAALLAFMFEANFGDVFVVIVPNCLLVLGMSLKWYGARQFEQKEIHHIMVWGPPMLFLGLCMIPVLYASYGAVYTTVNVFLAVLAAATAVVFWRARGRYPAPSRYATVLVYGLLAISFTVRVGQGFLAGEEMGRQIPDDVLLMIHLSVALVHLTGTGVFALSLAYERDAARLSWMANHDPLTGLLNRAAFESRMVGILENGESKMVALLMLDVDHFKEINDKYGHAAGDEALKSCATVLANTLPSESLATRWGGDEFVAILQGHSREAVKTLAGRVGQAVREAAVASESMPPEVSVSVGICYARQGQCDFDVLMRQADAALYSAKANGRDRAELIAA